MTNFERYNALHNEVMRRLEEGEITIEQAKEVNDRLFDKYFVESANIEEDNELEIFEESARQKYLELLAKKQDELKVKMDSEKELVKKGKSDKEFKRLQKQYDDLADKASQYSARAASPNMTDKKHGLLKNKSLNSSLRKDSNKDLKDGYDYLSPTVDEIDEENSISSKLKDKLGMHGKYEKIHHDDNRYNVKHQKNPNNDELTYVSVDKYDKKAKEAFNKDFKSKEPKNAALHDKINARSKKD